MDVRPMLATLAPAPLRDPRLVYEPKYDGIRAIVELTPGRPAPRVRIWSRNGNDKTPQFPSIVRALQAFGAGLDEPVLLDGEIVALDERGRPAGFQHLQGRIHLTGAREVARVDSAQPVALILFDLLRRGRRDLCALPLTERRRALEAALPPHARTDVLRVSEQVAKDGRALHARALKEGWEGLIAKEADSTYQAGRRSPAWRKLKLLHEQEFVVGGWTEPRQTRSHFGALLLGVYEGSALRYVGHTGTGFDQKELERVWTLLRARAAPRSPFAGTIKTNEAPHWVRPDLVAEVKFTEWTADGKLRHPVYLGLRDDKAPREVAREGGFSGSRVLGFSGSRVLGFSGSRVRGFSGSRVRGFSGSRVRASLDDPALTSVVEQLRALEDAGKDGTILLPDASRVEVTNLRKIFWPDLKVTKGELLRYYVEVSPYLLPAVADRPLVMKRFPNGVGGKAFYQQRSRAERPPAGVRIDQLPPGLDPIAEPDARRFVGGSLTTLLYMTQIAAISQDPWFSRIQTPLDADYVALDLDPGDDTPFARVLDVARWVRDELVSLGTPGFPKTSGASGLHVYVPMPPDTTYESGVLFCQIIATLVAARHPREATIERTVARRPAGTVYVDYLQNIQGKTLATAYSARASEFAGVSTPLTWPEVDAGIDPREFTIRTAVARFRQVGDLWAELRTGKAADLEAVFRKYQKTEARSQEDGRRRAEDGRRRAEGGGRKAEGGRRKTEGGGRKAEGGRRKAEGGRRKTEGGGRKAEGGRRKVKTECTRQETRGRRQEAGGHEIRQCGSGL